MTGLRTLRQGRPSWQNATECCSEDNIRFSIRRMTVWLLLVVAFLAALLSPHSLAGQDLSISQMVHTTWTARDGAPQAINALAQAPDGTLWIASDGGLFNFDGLTFNPFQPNPGEPQLPSTGIESVCVSRDGTVWAGLYLGGVARIANGHVTIFTKADELALHVVFKLHQAPDGSIWAINDQRDLIHFKDDGLWHKEEIPDRTHNSRIDDFLIDSSNTLWVPSGGVLNRRPLGQAHYTATSVPVDLLIGVAEASDGSIWINDVMSSVDRGRTQHVNHGGELIERLHDTEESQGLLFAPDGSLWMTTMDNGLHRVPRGRLVSLKSAHAPENAETFDHVRGLTSNHETVLLSDADGNIWSAGNSGLDRFKRGVLTPFIPDTRKGDWSVCTNDRGEVWIGGTEDQLYRLSGDSRKSFPKVDNVVSITCGKAGNIWLVANTGIWRADGDQLKRIPFMPRAGPFTVRQIVETKDHQLFACVSHSVGGFWVYKGGSWEKLDGAGLLGEPPRVEFIDSQDRLWTGYFDGQIGLPLSDGGRLYSSGKPGLGPVSGFSDTSHGFFAVGMNGLAVFRHDRFQMLSFVDQVSTRGLTGLVGSRNGDLWLNGSRGIFRVPVHELEQGLNDSSYQMKTESIREGEFIGPAQLMYQTPSAVRDAHGKMWFATLNGVVSLDPDMLHLETRPPVLSIRSIQADGHPVNDKTIAPKPQSILIQYFGVNLTAPENVIYKYKLDGLDDSWQAVGDRTEAVYTHLRPGKYTFELMASNGNEAWTGPAISTSFTVLPSFYQTWWFISLCVLAGLFISWLIVTMRVRTLASNIRSRAEERADERIRIARELHDTLLQGVQGLLLSFHVAAQKVSPDAESRRILEKALCTADTLIIEGRNRVNSLRSEHLTDGELVEALENVGTDLNVGAHVSYRVQRTGISGTLEAQVVDEIFYIAREALTNAFRHAQASEIVVTLHYSMRSFHMSCADNGCGFDASTGQRVSTQGHWGMRGMAERAEKIRARFSCQSKVNEGTEITVQIPSHRAYRQSPLLRSLFRRVPLGQTNETKTSKASRER